MRWFSIAAIYLLFWVLTAFAVLPFGLRTPDEEDDPTLVPGQANSAPVNFRPWRVVWRTTLISAVLLVLFYANWNKGWVTFDDIDFTQWVMPSK